MTFFSFETLRDLADISQVSGMLLLSWGHPFASTPPPLSPPRVISVTTGPLEARAGGLSGAHSQWQSWIGIQVRLT